MPWPYHTFFFVHHQLTKEREPYMFLATLPSKVWALIESHTVGEMCLCTQRVSLFPFFIAQQRVAIGLRRVQINSFLEPFGRLIATFAAFTPVTGRDIRFIKVWPILLHLVCQQVQFVLFLQVPKTCWVDRYTITVPGSYTKGPTKEYPRL